MSVDPLLFLTALGAGIVSFISPCNVALLPTFISYIGSSTKNWKQSLLMSMIYAIGFSFTFGIIGVIFMAGFMSLESRKYFNLISGIITILLALYLFFNKDIQKLTRKIKNKRYIQERLETSDESYPENQLDEISELDEENSIKKYTGYGGAFALGFSTGSSWIACVTPVFGAIISIGVIQNQYSTALYLMIFYGIGIMIPFILLGAFIGEINARILVKMIKYGAIIEKFFALILIWMGIEIILSGYGFSGLIEFL